MVSHRAGLSATAGLSCYTRISLLRDGSLCLYSNHNIMLCSSRCIVGILYFSILTAFHTLSLHLHFPLSAPAAASPYNGQNHNHSSIARYHGTTAAPRYHFYPRDAMLARVIAIATCPSVRLSVCPSRAGIVSKRRKLAA